MTQPSQPQSPTPTYQPRQGAHMALVRLASGCACLSCVCLPPPPPLSQFFRTPASGHCVTGGALAMSSSSSSSSSSWRQWCSMSVHWSHRGDSTGMSEWLMIWTTSAQPAQAIDTAHFASIAYQTDPSPPPSFCPEDDGLKSSSSEPELNGPVVSIELLLSLY